MLSVEEQQQGEESKERMMDELAGPSSASKGKNEENGVACPLPTIAAAVECSDEGEEADLMRLCTEELVKVSGRPSVPAAVVPPSVAAARPAPQHLSAAGSTSRKGAPTTGNNNSVASPCPMEATCPVAQECRSNAGRCGLMPTKHAESYYGYVETVEDAVMVVEACRFGRLMRVKRRLLEKERQAIRSGSVFVFVERESGIRRWTDGKVWSPSRICGEFLIYRELESRQPPPARKAPSQVNWTEQVAKILAAKRAANAAKMANAGEEGKEDEKQDDDNEGVEEPPAKKVAVISDEAVDSAVASIRLALAAAQQSSSEAANGAAANGAAPPTLHELQQQQASGGRAMVFKRDGLIKKTISLTVSDETYHLICYFKDSNLGSELLHLTPSRMAAFKNLDLCRNPVSYPIMMLQPGLGNSGGTSNPLKPPTMQQQQQQQQYYNPAVAAAAGRIVSNGQYIAIPQAYMAQFIPPQQPAPQPQQQHQAIAHQQYQQAFQQQQQQAIQQQYQQQYAYLANLQQQQQQHTRKMAPQPHQAQQQSIAAGALQLPPITLSVTNGPTSTINLINFKPPTPKSAGISSILAEPASACSSSSSPSTVDLENIESSCASSACAGNCPKSSTCLQSRNAPPEPVAPAAKEKADASSLEEEQLLFCHFLQSICHESP